jgi:hypothetical protein
MDSYHKVVAERVYFHFSSQLSELMLYDMRESIKVDAIANQIAGGFIVQLRGWMLGRKMPVSTELGYVEYPAGVWQMFKDKFLPAWLKARFPVRMTRVSYVKSISEYSVCPHLNSDAARSNHIEFMMRRP